METVITVTVQDDNDNMPIFDHQFYSFVIPYPATTKQGSPQNKFVGRVHALDRDAAGPNSFLSYSFAAGATDFFSVDEASGGIFTQKELSYYRKSSSNGILESSHTDNTYRLRVVATDGGSPPMSSECEVSITLVHGNEHAPIFHNPSQMYGGDVEIAVPINVAIGAELYRVIATDEDSEILTFSIATVGKVNASDYFSINPTSGLIEVQKSLHDITEGTALTIEIIVEDNGAPKLSDTASLSFLITGDNLYAPVFQAPTTRIYIREDEQVGAAIITVRATDQDIGVNGHVTYNILESADPDRMFAIEPSTGIISVQKPLDYESVPIYNIIIEAHDAGFKSKSSTSSVKVILQDVDDNPPIFPDTGYTAPLKENAPTGTVVTQMIAIDNDSAKNAEIEYGLIETPELGESQFFEVDRKTGIVTSLISFDYEQIDRIDLKIQASSPSGYATTETTLSVLIQGENEFYPKFKQPIFRFDVSEVVPVGGTVGVVEAVDRDHGEDGEVHYYFVGSSNDAGFHIDHTTGVISVKNELDRESQNRYVLTILAKNRGSIRGNDTDEAQVDIQVLDGNDPPVFRKAMYTATISESSLIGHQVITVSAVDKDVKPRNSQFSYSIHWSGEENAVVDANGPIPFTIGSTSGVIAVSGKLDRESIAFYDLEVRATDLGVPPAVGVTHLQITLTDVNDSPPQLSKSERKGFVKENSPPDSFVKQFKATDPDLQQGVSHGGDKAADRFTYYLLPGKDAALLKLDSRTGILRTKNTIDREKHPNGLQATVEVQDGGDPPLSARYNFFQT